jgi:hypothetical protein
MMMSAPIFTGMFPSKLNTVTASVLRGLCMRKQTTSLDQVYESSTTRLAAVVYSLELNHGWTIQRADISAPTDDGRVATVTSYFLSPVDIQAAFDNGAREFCEQVALARNLRRTQKKLCKQKSFARNTRRAKSFHDQWQMHLNFPL